MRSRTALIPVAGCAVLLAACGGIPSSSGPMEAGDAGPAEDSQQVVRDLEPAAAGMSPQEIVSGFLFAMEIYEPPSGYPTAATYLTRQARAEWEERGPLSEIVIYRGGVDDAIEFDEETNVATLTLEVEARYDRVDGFVRYPDDAEPQTYTLPLEQVAGEWRVAEPPDGLMIESEAFERYFAEHSLYFFNAGLDDANLVPDPVYLPTTANVQTLLVQELLAGPSDRLSTAVETAFPAGTSLEPAAVTVSGGDATVNLSDQAVTRADGGATRPATREGMVAQLTATLGGLRDVRRVQVVSGATRLSGSDDDPYISVATATGPAGQVSRLYALSESGLSRVTDGSSPSVTSVAGPLGSRSDLTEVAINRGHDTAAAITEGNELIMAGLRDESTVMPLFEGAVSFDSLAWDGHDLLWAIERPPDGASGTDDTEADAEGDSGNRLLLIDPETGESEDVTPQTPDGAQIEQFAIARDGTRIAVIIDGAVHVAIVERDPDALQDPAAVDVHGLRRLHPDGVTGPVGDLAWFDANTLALLTDPAPPAKEEEIGVEPGEAPAQAQQTGMPEVRTVDLGVLRASEDRSIPEGATISAPAVDNRAAIGAAEGVIWIRSETGRWITLDGLRAPAFAG